MQKNGAFWEFNGGEMILHLVWHAETFVAWQLWFFFTIDSNGSVQSRIKTITCNYFLDPTIGFGKLDLWQLFFGILFLDPPIGFGTLDLWQTFFEYCFWILQLDLVHWSSNKLFLNIVFGSTNWIWYIGVVTT